MQAACDGAGNTLPEKISAKVVFYRFRSSYMIRCRMCTRDRFLLPRYLTEAQQFLQSKHEPLHNYDPKQSAKHQHVLSKAKLAC